MTYAKSKIRNGLLRSVQHSEGTCDEVAYCPSPEEIARVAADIRQANLAAMQATERRRSQRSNSPRGVPAAP